MIDGFLKRIQYVASTKKYIFQKNLHPSIDIITKSECKNVLKKVTISSNFKTFESLRLFYL